MGTVYNIGQTIGLVSCIIPQGSPKAASRFLLEPDYEEFDRDDPTARARVGPSPQLLSGGDANYTVIYNFASPTPRRKEEADKDDGGYAGKSSFSIQGWAKRRSPGCVNAAGNARQEW